MTISSLEDLFGDGSGLVDESSYPDGTSEPLILFPDVQSLPLAPLSEGNIHYVSTGSDSEYQSIRAAVDAALPGDVIIVGTGIYRENLSIEKSIEIS